jgi:hypothetical protein
MIDRNRRLSADEIEALLPWYAAGTLDARLADQVEAALAADAGLARRLDLVREEMTETITLNEALGAPSARVMENLFSAIDRERRDGREPATRGGLIGWLTELFSSRNYSLAGAAAVVLIAVQAAVIAGLVLQNRGTSGQGGGYTPASSEIRPAPDHGLERNFALVQFAPQASMVDVTHFLDGRRAAIMEGPDNGMYKVRLGDKYYVTKDEKDGLISAFQSASGIVISAVPSE